MLRNQLLIKKGSRHLHVTTNTHTNIPTTVRVKVLVTVKKHSLLIKDEQCLHCTGKIQHNPFTVFSFVCIVLSSSVNFFVATNKGMTLMLSPDDKPTI